MTVHTATGICQTDTATATATAYWQAVAVSVWHMPVAVSTVMNSWWWTVRPSETCRVLFQNKINLRQWCIWLVLLWKYITMHGPLNFSYKTLDIIWQTDNLVLNDIRTWLDCEHNVVFVFIVCNWEQLCRMWGFHGGVGVVPSIL